MKVWYEDNRQVSPSSLYPHRILIGVTYGSDADYENFKNIVTHYPHTKNDKRGNYKFSDEVVSWLDGNGYEYELLSRRDETYFGVITLCFKNEDDLIHFKMAWL